MSATFWHVIIAGILALAAVLIFLGRRGIRSRFGRNMPESNEAFLARMKREGRYPPMPLPIPPPPIECPVHGELPTGGPCRACLADELAKGESAIREFIAATEELEEPPPTKDSVPELAGDEANRAHEIRLIAERIFVAHPDRDPEQAYRDAVRWIDSRVATALAEYRDPGEPPTPEEFCQGHRWSYPKGGHCPICASPERSRTFAEDMEKALGYMPEWYRAKIAVGEDGKARPTEKREPR